MDMQRQASARPARVRRALIAAAAVTALALALTPQVLATDVADIGIVDQAAIGNLSQFQDAKTQLTRIQQQLQGQFQAAIKGKSAADQQRISQDFQNRLAQQQHQIFDPLLGRANAALVERFGLQSGRFADKFAGLRYRLGETGAPILDDVLGYVEGRVLQSLDAGDHTARLLEPVAAALPDRASTPLTSFEVLGRGLDRRSGPAGGWTGYAPDPV